MYDMSYLDQDTVLFTGLDDAFIGVTHLPDNPHIEVSVYSYSKLIKHFMEEFSDCDDAEEMAIEHIDFNVIGSNISERTPMIVYDDGDVE